MSDGKPIRRNSGQSPGRRPSRSSSSRLGGKEGGSSQLSKMSVDEVAAWLQQHGHADAAERFKHNAITGQMLEGITDAELKDMGVALLGERKKLLLLIEDAVGPRDSTDSDRGRPTKSYSADHAGRHKPDQSPYRPPVRLILRWKHCQMQRRSRVLPVTACCRSSM
jgi:hypothetical protein